ncbi:LLM class flavin-dependent oxidoreductase [Actinoallomurus rhizosphaericola]|uniref:LLM class flavin-dependent oxidoreductase n=1 Tax=Actinoallomurus rhizosphaericola TaxID=2952536 RepID=UPI002090E7EE|nr:LLM class flavin-dependent oxidoreductase [Actinoallomurus rhizosphaericola]MCO5992437.1 LLM class flavin-dependent oxidoreductase [Actinoallomurus rhizosphaericola]
MSELHELPLSVLDLVPVSSDTTPGAALRASIDLAKAVERLGYHRLWVAEHHNMPGIASSSPPVLIAHLAEATSTLRVGSGGVMLPNHAPLVVAEQFGMLEALHPGRIDLGIGRAPGTDQATAYALRRSADLNVEDFPRHLAELRAFLSGSSLGIRAVPTGENPPEVWLLGSSGYSAQLAGALGLPFAFAHHFSARFTEPALELYRSTFQPSETLSRPHAMVTAAVVCADTDEEAERLAAPMGLSMLRLRTGKPGPLPTPEEAQAYPYTPQEREAIGTITESHVIGGPETVRKGLLDLIDRTQPDELMISTNVGDPAARLRSYELVKEILRAD